MSINSISVNLPVKSLQKSRAFWTKLGFSFNEDFCDDKGLCLILKEDGIHAMLLTHEMFATFTNRSIADKTTTQVLLAIEVESREKVDEVVKLALENGGSRYGEAADHGWMYYDSFADIDGHQWEIMRIDSTKVPTESA